MAEWIITIATVLSFMAGAVIWVIKNNRDKKNEAVENARKEAEAKAEQEKRDAEQERRDSELERRIEERHTAQTASILALKESVTMQLGDVKKEVGEIKNILGNGKGLINDVREIAKCVAVDAALNEGKAMDIYTRLSAQQHEINELKGKK